jgi:hypothetical protein
MVGGAGMKTTNSIQFKTGLLCAYLKLKITGLSGLSKRFDP